MSAFSMMDLEAARAGDPRAIERLLLASQPNIRRYAERSCIWTHVDDAVQETMWILARYVAQLRQAAAYSSWLLSIVRRECRRLARRSLGIDLWDDARVDAWVAERPSETMRLEVAAAFESLPPEFREVLVLRDFEGLTIGEAAARLGITRAATKSRLHRARALAREYLLDAP
ncbi:MAG: RNA polymerase sigma factor [Myxococcales bacterium]